MPNICSKSQYAKKKQNKKNKWDSAEEAKINNFFKIDSKYF